MKQNDDLTIPTNVSLNTKISSHNQKSLDQLLVGSDPTFHNQMCSVLKIAQRSNICHRERVSVVSAGGREYLRNST